MVRNFFGPQPLRGAFGDEVGGVERQQDFGEDGFDAGLAGFAGDDVGDFVAVGEDGVAKIAERRGFWGSAAQVRAISIKMAHPVALSTAPL